MATVKSISKKSPKKRTLLKLSPTEFEHLIFDLAVVRGMVNIAWRTPGPDGGRDIEATSVETDFAGYQSARKWFIECKRYVGSIDWPTIYDKLSYADTNRANFLLLCTTSKFTPTAITQSDNWNAQHRPVTIRLWPGHELELQLQQYPDLLLKYGLADTPGTPGKSLVDLALTLSKSVDSHYSRLVFEDHIPDLMLQASQALASLLTTRMEDISREGRIIPQNSSRPLTGIIKCTVSGTGGEIDEAGLNALVCYIVALLKQVVHVKFIAPDHCQIIAAGDLNRLFKRYLSAFSAIAIWSNCEISLSGSTIDVRQRT